MTTPASDAAAQTRVVSFDAGGTLFALAEPVGATYARLARDAGFDVRAAAMEDGFARAFATAPPLAASPEEQRRLLAFEHGWWRRVVDASLDHALADECGAIAPHDDPRRAWLFAAAFAHYARASAWRLFPDVVPVLATLRERGLTLLVISNFDRRLHDLLAGFGIADAFAIALASSEAGAAKPARAIFDEARRRLGDVPAASCLHVGDSWRDDVEGARAAGWRAAWLDRPPGDEAQAAAASRITTLAELPALVQASS